MQKIELYNYSIQSFVMLTWRVIRVDLVSGGFAMHGHVLEDFVEEFLFETHRQIPLGRLLQKAIFTFVANAH